MVVPRCGIMARRALPRYAWVSRGSRATGGRCRGGTPLRVVGANRTVTRSGAGSNSYRLPGDPWGEYPLLLTPKVGQRGIGMIGFGTMWVALLIAAAALYRGKVVIPPFAAAVMMVGQHCAASNCMTIPTVVAKP